MKRMMIGLLFATLATNAFAYYMPGQGRWTSRDPFESHGRIVVHEGKVRMKRENPASPEQINLYRFVNNDGINYFDPLGLTVYLVHVPSGIPLVDHRMIIGDDGNGGSYLIDFGPQGGGCNRVCGPGVIDYRPNPFESAWTRIQGLPGVAVHHWVLTTDRVDAQLAQDAADWYQNTQPPTFIVGFRDCNQFAWSWINWARFLQDQNDQIIWFP
jgi:RHS repeat-associated protein